MCESDEMAAFFDCAGDEWCALDYVTWSQIALSRRLKRAILRRNAPSWMRKPLMENRRIKIKHWRIKNGAYMCYGDYPEYASDVCSEWVVSERDSAWRASVEVDGLGWCDYMRSQPVLEQESD